VRGYVTEDKAGDSYDMVFTGININRAWKDNNTWFGEYVGAFLRSNPRWSYRTKKHIVLHRQGADTGRLLPGTSEFQTVFDRVTNDPDLATGSRFQDNSKIYHSDVNYNFSHLSGFCRSTIRWIVTEQYELKFIWNHLYGQ
jgi:iron complex outermembrane receptor protein